MKYLREYIIAILVVGCFLLAGDSLRQRRGIEAHERTETVLKAKYDSITLLRNHWAVEYMKLATEFGQVKLALSNEREANKTLRQRNETLKNRPVRAYSDSAAMREITRLVGDH